MSKSKSQDTAPATVVDTVDNTVANKSQALPEVIVVEGRLTDVTLQAPLFAELPAGKYIIEYRDSRMDVVMPLPVFWDGKTLFA